MQNFPQNEISEKALRTWRALREIKKEAWTPSILDRSAYNTWKDKGSPTIEELADKKLKKILEMILS